MSIIKVVYDVFMLVGVYYGYLAVYKPDSMRFKYYGKKLSAYPPEVKMECDRYCGLRLIAICIFNIVALHTFEYLPPNCDKYEEGLIWLVFIGASLSATIGTNRIMKKYDESHTVSKKIES